MREPTTIAEAEVALGQLAHADPAAVMLVFLDQLIDLAITNGTGIRGPLYEYMRLKFYKAVIATLILKGVRA